MYSELLKVPAAFKLPGNAYAGRRIRELAQFPDVLPTLLDAAGLGNNNYALQGHSLLPLIRGDVSKVREAVISGFHSGIDRCIRDETWSLILRPDEQPDELYNLKDDPKEQHNLIDVHRDEARRLARIFGPIYTAAARDIKGLQGRFEVEHTAAG